MRRDLWRTKEDLDSLKEEIARFIRGHMGVYDNSEYPMCRLKGEDLDEDLDAVCFTYSHLIGFFPDPIIDDMQIKLATPKNAVSLMSYFANFNRRTMLKENKGIITLSSKYDGCEQYVKPLQGKEETIMMYLTRNLWTSGIAIPDYFKDDLCVRESTANEVADWRRLLLICLLDWFYFVRLDSSCFVDYNEDIKFAKELQEMIDNPVESKEDMIDTVTFAFADYPEILKFKDEAIECTLNEVLPQRISSLLERDI